MKKKELEQLAQKVQLELKEEELTKYLKIFQELEKMLTNFKKIKTGKKTITMTRINTGYLTLSDLEKLAKKCSNSKISKKILQKNSLITKENFVLFRK